jgi:hypothetical protein
MHKKVWFGAATAAIFGAMASAALYAQSPGGTAVTLGGRQFWISDWGYVYWSGNREIFGANSYKDKTKPTANLSIVIEGGKSSGWWSIDWTYIDQSAVGKSCGDDEKIVSDLARLAGLAVERIQVGQCKSTWEAIGPKALRTTGGIEFRRTTPLIATTPKIPSGNTTTAPSKQGTVRYAPLGSGNGTTTGPQPKRQAPPADNLSMPAPSAQEQAELAAREKLNREQAVFAAGQLADNKAAQEAFEQAKREREATIARQQAEHRAEVERLEREHAAAIKRWEADAAACRAGDMARCAAPTAPR